MLLAVHRFFTPPEHHPPASHSVQTPPRGPYQPASHTHAEDEVLTTGDIEFEGHATEELPPEQKEPAGHNAQSPPSGPKNPGRHLQSFTSSLPEEEVECIAHTLSCPLAQNVSASQRVHGPPASPS
mmetsp:Transcript_4668/g.10278  ORF Transcript_4668/g.10278 Transcript_4668/m.10278 type:complete len:126 (+) Transcript_4668:795-1172(+)